MIFQLKTLKRKFLNNKINCKIKKITYFYIVTLLIPLKTKTYSLL